MTSLSNSRRWTLVGLLFLAALINYLDRATLSIALPAISNDFSLNPTSEGLLLSAFFWSYALMQIPMGWLADRWNLRWLYAGAFALLSLTCGLTGIVGSFAMLIFLRVLLGVGASIYMPGSTKVVSQTFPPEERGLPSGVFDSGTNAGLVVGMLFVAILVAKTGWRHMFMLVGFLALIWIIPWVLAFPHALSEQHSTPKTDKGSLRGATLNRNLLGASLGYLCYSYFGYMTMAWLPDYFVKVRHLTLLKAGAFSALPFLVWAVSEPIGGWVADTLIRRGMDSTRVRKSTIAFSFVTGLLLIPGVWVRSETAALVLICASSLVGFGAGNILAIFQICAPPQEVGTWMGVGNFTANIGGILSPLVTGIVISRTGSYFAGFALAPLVLLCGLACFVFLVGKVQQAPSSVRTF
ncbi:MAG: MFS transporter [Terriglobia bacterium]